MMHIAVPQNNGTEVNMTDLSEHESPEMYKPSPPLYDDLPEMSSGSLLRREEKNWALVPASDHSQNTINPIRRIVDVMAIQPNPSKELIKLHIGDPTITGNLPTHPKIIAALVDSVQSQKYNGYGPAIGFPHVREAVAEFVSAKGAPITAEDVVLTSGCSHALQIAIETLANPGQNILIPRPGFSVYATQMTPHHIEARYYDLLMSRGWEVDLYHLESLIDEKTAAIIVNNPSNPCGAVYSKEHLEDILRIAERFKVPIIADEIYGDMVFDGAVFHPMATLQPKVPILSTDGLSKRWLVPGWRLGWLTIHDPCDVLKDVRVGLRQLTQKIVGPCAVIQGALPAILSDTPKEYFEHTAQVLSNNANICEQELRGCPGMTPVKSYGAMYMMLGLDMSKFDDFQSEMEFVQALIAEESVYCLPGTAFNYPNAIRLVITYPEDKTREACKRVKDFCRRHYRPDAKLKNKRFIR